MGSHESSDSEASRREIERLQAELNRLKGDANLSFLGETLSPGVVRELSNRRGQKKEVHFRNAGVGMHGDGNGLWLQVTQGNGRSWIYRYRRSSKSYEIGLGSAAEVTLAEARSRAVICRRLVREGVDLKQRKRELAAIQVPQTVAAITFKEAAEQYIRAQRAGWKGEKQETVWNASLETYVYPTLGSLAVKDVDTGVVMKVFEQTLTGGKMFWEQMPETANRVRGRIEAVLDWAKVRSHRSGDNPARWRGHLEHQLPAPNKVRPIAHFSALPFTEMFEFYEALRGRGGFSAECLRFTILTACRSGESIGATWSEIDLEAKVWAIPAKRTKTGKDHRVPLSAPAIAILERVGKLGTDATQFVFPGLRKGRSLSATAMLALMRKMDRRDLTTHGFRSTFRDWAAETTTYANEVVEMALSHAVGSKVEASYRRGDLFDRRRSLMTEWAGYCSTPPDQQLPTSAPHPAES